MIYLALAENFQMGVGLIQEERGPGMGIQIRQQ
jgi:hypothetical protein